MPVNLVEEIATKAATLPYNKQREVLQVVEALVKQNQLSESPTRRCLKGDLAGLDSITAEEIDEARREMWRGYMEGDE